MQGESQPMVCEYCKLRQPYLHKDIWWHEGGVLCQVPLTIEPLLKSYDRSCAYLQCDGFTRIAHYLLLRVGITHSVHTGRVYSPQHAKYEWTVHTASMY